MKWRYDPKPEPAAQGVACCDHVNRGACYDGGRVYFNTLDSRIHELRGDGRAVASGEAATSTRFIVLR